MSLSSYFIGLLNVSIAASYVALVIIVLRLIFKKIPKWAMCVLWALVALRLILPFTPESVFSLIPSAKTVPENIITSSSPAIDSGIKVVNSVVNPIISKTAEQIGDGISVIGILSIVWAAGFAAMTAYALTVYIRLRLRLRESIEIEDGVYICDRIESPFLFGFIKPKIYIPSGLDEEDARYVISHERAHMRRFDHVWKPCGFFLLSLHWFNPALWAAYILLCKDIEYACDEKVISEIGADFKRAYSTALLNCSISRRAVSACPVAFGECDVKGRILNVLSYKKPALWVIILSAVATAVVSVCFLTNPIKAQGGEPEEVKTQITKYPDGGDHEYFEEIISRPSCTAGGSARYTCVHCGKTFVSMMRAAGHDYIPEVTVKPDCVTRGVTTYTCKGCGDSYEVEGDTAPDVHNYVSAVTVEPNCTTREIVTYTCENCGDTYDAEGDFAPTAHDYYVKRVIKEPTCLNDGYNDICCSRCGDEFYEWRPELDHEFTPVSEDNPYTCAICGVIDEGERSYYNGEWKIDIPSSSKSSSGFGFDFGMKSYSNGGVPANIELFPSFRPVTGYGTPSASVYATIPHPPIIIWY